MLTSTCPDIQLEQQSQPSVSDVNNASSSSPDAQAISKSQLKKQIKRQKWMESRDERRKIERERRKLKRKSESQERLLNKQNGQLSVPKPKRPVLMKESDNKFKVVIDMDFEDFMTDMEINKAVQQVGRIYSANRHSNNPCQLYISSLKGKILDRFAITNAGHKKWDINCSEKDYVDLFKEKTPNDDTLSNFIYLTGDSDNTLPDVNAILKDESKIFVIGGLVDHNRHKNLCHERAVTRNIQTARLPIKEHVKLCQRDILSTVTVFEIVLQVLGSHSSWPEALLAAIPKRKIACKNVVISEKDEASDNKSSGDSDVKSSGDCDTTKT